MAPDAAESPFFQKRRAQGRIVVKEPPKFDLESYISNYQGFTRIDRLRHIGSHSTYLAIEAYRTAIVEAKRGKDVKIYTELVEEMNQIAPGDTTASMDMVWAEDKTKKVTAEHDKLEHELKSYKNNMIKESIRMGNEDMGHFFFACGDFSNALKAYARMRENCTSSKHMADMILRLIFVSVTQKSWHLMQSHIARIESAQLKGDEKLKLDPIVSACVGLGHMCVGKFRDAATAFISTSQTFLNVESVSGIYWQKEVLTPNDVAVYGGLCALATMDRSELQDQVLANNDFRTFLELEPHIRRAINLFCGSKYSACLEILESYRNDYLLDVYLSPVLANIYSRIRTKSIVQYFIPFSCVTLDEMANRFQLTGEYASIEDELETMINNKTLNARIDLVDRLLISPPTNARYTVHAEALAMAEEYDHTLRLRLTRLNMLAAGMTVREEKGSQKEAGPGFGESIGAGIRGFTSRMLS